MTEYEWASTKVLIVLNRRSLQFDKKKAIILGQRTHLTDRFCICNFSLSKRQNWNLWPRDTCCVQFSRKGCEGVYSIFQGGTHWRKNLYEFFQSFFYTIKYAKFIYKHKSYVLSFYLLWGFFKYYCKNANSICFSTYCPEGPQELPTFVIAIIFDSRSTRISLNWKKFTDTSLVSHETWLRCHNSKKLLQLLIKFGNYGNSINPKKLWVYGIEFDFILMLFFPITT